MVCIDNYGNLVTYDDGYSTYELYHHGIRGQRWGRKNGPPYPLDAGDHSAAERKAGWTKSLASVAKATGKGVAKAARATGHGVKVAAKGTKKALIRVNLYPKKLMSAEDIAEKVERMRQEDTLKHAMGKLSNEDKLMLKMKAKDARREVAKQALSQLLPAIGKDLIIPTVKQGILDKLEVKKKEALNDIDLDFKEETNTLDASNKHSEKLWNDVYESALAAGKSLKEAKKIADQGGDKELGKKPSSQEDKERDKKVWNDLYEDARDKGKSASEAREIADSGKSDIAARKSSNDKNGGKNQFNLDSEIEKDIYNTAKKHGFTATEAAEMARNRDDSKLKGLFSNSSDGNDGGNKKNKGGNNQNPQPQQQQQPQQQPASKKVDLPKSVKEQIMKEWIKAGYTQKQAFEKAEAGDDYVGRFKKSYEKQAKDYDNSWADAIKENNRRDGARKAQETKKFNQEFSTIINETTTKKGVSVSDKSAQDRLRDAVKAEQERTEKAIKERGGTNIQIKGGKMYYTDDDGVNRVNNFVDRAVDRFEIEERKKG